MISNDPSPPTRLSRVVTQSPIPESDCSHWSTRSSRAKRPQLELRRSGRHFGVVGLISTLVVFIITAGIATLMLGWLYAYHDPIAAGGGIMAAIRNGSFVIKEPSGAADEESVSPQTQTETLRVLMFSALASHLVSVTSTILVTLLAYRSAAQWLRSSEDPDGANLTPIQYGLLIRTLGSGSLMSIINSLRYASRSKRASAPRLFKEALVGVTGIYVLSHVVGLVDLWLHSSARSISVYRDVPIQSEALFGIAYNESTCGSFNMAALPCQNLISERRDGTHWAFDQPWMSLAGFDTISDANPDLKLEYINNTAILVPGSNRNFKSQGFSIHTQGLQVKCANLRDRCDRPVSPLLAALVPGSSPVSDCSKAGYPRIPYHTSGKLYASGRDTRNIQNLVMGIIGDEMGGMINGTADFSSGWTSNPAKTVIQLRWVNNTAQWNSGTPGVTYLNALDLYATCELTYLDVTAQYDSIGAEWSILESALSRPELASVLWTPVMFQLATDDLRNTIRPYITSRGGQAMGVLESSMAKYGIGYTAPLMKFIAASNVTAPQLVALGLYPTAPTLLLVGCLYIYSLVALVIFLLSCTSNNRMIFVPRELTKKKEKDVETSALDVAQSWLTDPLPLVGSIFPGGDGQHVARSAESDPLRQVYDSDWELGKVGIGLYKGSKGEMIFGLMRQSHSRSRRYGRIFPVVEEDSVLQERVLVHGRTVIVPSLAMMGKAES